MEENIEFTIILPVYHGGNLLTDTIKSLHKLDFPADQFEVLVSGHEHDETARNIVDTEACEAKFHLKYICSNSKRRSVELNKACNAARGNILYFTDDDSMLFSETLKNLKAIFQSDPDIAVVGGPDILEHKGEAFDLALDYVLNSFLGTGGVRKPGGMSKYYPKLWNMALNRDIARSVSLKNEEGFLIFDESLPVCEEIELIRRIEKTGKKSIFSSQIPVRHYRDTNYFAFMKRNFLMARTVRTLCVHRLPHMLLALFASGITALGFLSFFSQNIRHLFFFSIFIYLLTLFISGIKGFMKTKKISVLLYIPVLLFSLHFLRGLGYLFPWSDK